MPPVADMTSGVKVPCSTWRIRSLCCFFFLFSFTSYYLGSSGLKYRFVVGLKVLTSKNATWPVNRKPRALISTLAWSDFLAVFSENISPLNGYSCGSTRKSLQTSVHRLVAAFRIWLWRKVTNLPFGHWKACCKLNLLPHTQWHGIRFNLQPYLIDSRSQKLCLFRMYPSSLIGRVVSQEDVPVSRFRSFCFSFLWAHFISYNFENLFLSIVFHRLYLLFLIIQFRIWFMSFKLISNAIAKMFWYHDGILIFYFAFFKYWYTQSSESGC